MDYQDWFKEQLKTYKNDPEFILDGILLNINEMICSILEKRGMTRREFGKKLNVSPAYITKLLRGDPNLTLKSLVKISQALGLSLDVRLKESEVVKRIERDFEKSDFETIPFEVSGGSINDETKFIVKAS
jgi:transcriptional regulator with XRE-family HTH domain